MVQNDYKESFAETIHVVTQVTLAKRSYLIVINPTAVAYVYKNAQKILTQNLLRYYEKRLITCRKVSPIRKQDVMRQDKDSVNGTSNAF